MKMKASKIHCFILVLGFAFVGRVHAGTIEFTTEEGYTSDELWRQTPADGYNWNTLATPYGVNTTGGGTLSATVPTNVYAYPARYLKPIPVAYKQPLSAYVDFRVTGHDIREHAPTWEQRQGLAGIDFGTSGVFGLVFGGSINTFEWLPDGVYGFQINAIQGFTGSLSPESLGLTAEGGMVSDLLRLSLNATVAESGLSSFLFEIINLDGGSNIVSVTGQIDLSSYENLYLGVTSGGSYKTVTTWVAERIHIEDPPPSLTMIIIQ